MKSVNRILWIHNNERDVSGFFMWDILDYMKSLSAVDIEEHQIPVIRSWQAIRTIWAQRRGLKNKDVDLVHAQFGSLVGLYTALLGYPMILSLRGSDTYAIGGVLTRSGFASRIRVLFSWIGAVKAKKIIVMSEAMRMKVAHWSFVDMNKIHVICDPVGDSFWPVDRIPDLELKNSLTIMSGSLQADNPVKRLSIVSDAIRICNASCVSVSHYQISGIPRGEMKAAIADCDYLAIPSAHEGWPNIVKEALLTGKNFISTNVSDLKHFALTGSGNIISQATPVDFALAFTDAFVTKITSQEPTSIHMIAFHPLSCSLKHLVVYNSIPVKSA